MKWKTAIITVSDSGFQGTREDKSGPMIRKLLEEAGSYEIIREIIVPDDQEKLEEALRTCADTMEADLILTTGGTGFSMRDRTPEATMNVATRNAPGIAEAMRALSLKVTPRAMLSRGASVIRNETLIVNLPGSPKAVKECLEFILSSLPHGLGILKGLDGECGGTAS